MKQRRRKERKENKGEGKKEESKKKFEKVEEPSYQRKKTKQLEVAQVYISSDKINSFLF